VFNHLLQHIAKLVANNRPIVNTRKLRRRIANAMAQFDILQQRNTAVSKFLRTIP